MLGAGRAGRENLVAGSTQMREAGSDGGFVVHVCADGHQTAQFQATHVADALREVDGVADRSAGFRRFAGFVDFHSMVSTNGRILPILLDCSWPIR